MKRLFGAALLLALLPLAAAAAPLIAPGQPGAGAANAPAPAPKPPSISEALDLGELDDFKTVIRVLKGVATGLEYLPKPGFEPGTRKVRNQLVLFGPSLEVAKAVAAWKTVHQRNLAGLRAEVRYAEFVEVRYLTLDQAKTLVNQAVPGAGGESGRVSDPRNTGVGNEGSGGQGVPGAGGSAVISRSTRLAGEIEILDGSSAPLPEGITNRNKPLELAPDASGRNAEAGTSKTETSVAVSNLSFSKVRGSASLGTKGQRLLLVGTESQLQLAKDLLIAADVPPLQVLIEARILEVAPETVLNAGFEWVDNATGKLTGTTIAEKGPHGFAIGRVTRTRFDDVSVRVQALLQDRKSRVLASPQLKIVDGGVAEIFSGTNFTGSLVPEDNPLSGTTTLLGVTHTGVQLLVNPQVHLGKDGVPSQITVRIVPSVSAPLLREGSKKVPDRILRRMDTTVLLRDGEMLAIGGLINEDEIREIQKVPLLSEIPYLGELFKRRKVDRRRSELMVVLTARVLIPGRDIPLATREFQDQVPALAGFTLTPQVKAGDPPTDAVPEDGRVAGLVRLVAAAPAGGMDVRLELPDSPAALGLEFEQVTGLRTGQGADDVQDARTILVHVPAGEYLARFHFRAAVKHQDRVVPIQAVVGSQKRTIRLHIFELK